MSDLSTKARELRPGLVPSVGVGVAPFLGVIGVALLAQLVIFPWMVGHGYNFEAKLSVDIAISIVLAVSLTMVNGFTGQFSIGHAAFMAVGAYTSACIVYYGSHKIYGNADMMGGMLSAMKEGRSGAGAAWLTGADVLFAGAVLSGGVVAAGCGYLVGLPSLRLKGDYLAIVTLGFGEIVRALVQSQTSEVLSEGSSVTEDHLKTITAWQGKLTTDDYLTAANVAELPWYLWPKYVGGALGFAGLPSYNSLFWAVLAAGATLVVAYRIKTSTYGRAFLSIREDEIAAEAMGVNTTAYKVKAFAIAAFFAGIAGGLFCHTIGVQLNPGELGFQKSFDIIIMVVLGGMGSISGAAIAAGLVTWIPEKLRKPAELGDMWVAGISLIVLGLVVAAVLNMMGRNRALGKGIAIVGGIALGLSGLAHVAITYNVDLSRYRMVLFALALIAMMLLRPQGLLGLRELWDKSLWLELFAPDSVKKGAKP